MLDVPLDSWYAWLGLSLAGVALVGAASGLPTAHRRTLLRRLRR